jgi:hypothetical protein
VTTQDESEGMSQAMKLQFAKSSVSLQICNAQPEKTDLQWQSGLALLAKMAANQERNGQRL